MNSCREKLEELYEKTIEKGDLGLALAVIDRLQGYVTEDYGKPQPLIKSMVLSNGGARDPLNP